MPNDRSLSPLPNVALAVQDRYPHIDCLQQPFCNRCAERILRAISFVSISSPDQNDEELFASALSETKPDHRRAHLWPKSIEQHDKQQYGTVRVVVSAHRSQQAADSPKDC